MLEEHLDNSGNSSDVSPAMPNENSIPSIIRNKGSIPTIDESVRRQQTGGGPLQRPLSDKELVAKICGEIMIGQRLLLGTLPATIVAVMRDDYDTRISFKKAILYLVAYSNQPV